MRYNYQNEMEELISIALILNNKLKDISCYTDKRTNEYKIIKSLIKKIEEFNDFDKSKNYQYTNNKKVFDIQIDIELLKDLHEIKEYTNRDSLNDTLNYFLKKFKKTLIKDCFVKVDELKDIPLINTNIVNSEYEEKFLEDNKIKYYLA